MNLKNGGEKMVENEKLEEEDIKYMMMKSGRINKEQLHRDFTDKSHGQIMLAILSDYTRRLLNLCETLTFQRIQLELRDKTIRTQKAIIKRLEAKINKQKPKRGKK